jgi:hypothetical protein
MMFVLFWTGWVDGHQLNARYVAVSLAGGESNIRETRR